MPPNWKSTSIVTGLALAISCSTAFGSGGHRMGQRSDANQDGKISLEESLNSSEARFVRLDGDESGSLTKEEYVTSRFGKFSNSAWFQRRQQERADRFTEIDSDSDSVLSKEEYLKHAELRFSTRDTNGDGFLTSDEFRSRRNSQDPSTGI